jgi:hypothetical protein
MPLSSDVNNLTSISLGRCRKIRKPIHGKVTKLHPITYNGSPSRIPISCAENAWTRKTMINELATKEKYLLKGLLVLDN